jgi:hypothetical protein
VLLLIKIKEVKMLFFKIFTFLSSLVFIAVSVSAQPNSIELKDGSGTLLSSHASITEAYNAIPATITNAYIIEILSTYTGATETFPIGITSRSGSSIDNTITLRPALTAPGIDITTSINNNPVINLDGVSYFILDGRPGGVNSSPDGSDYLTVENTLTSGTSTNTINMTNGSSNNVIRYCNLRNNTQNTAGPRVVIFGGTTGQPNNNNIVEYNNIIGGRSGVGMIGQSGIPNSGNIIRYNTISNFGFAGIWMLQNGENTTIEGNTIFQTTGVSTTAAYGINLGASGTGGINNIFKNEIYDIQHTSTSTSASIRGIYGTVGVGSTMIIFNNFISLTLNNQNTVSTTGIHFIGSNDFTANIFYNSIRIGGAQTGGTSGNVVSAGIQQSNSSASLTVNIKNNIAVNNRTGGTSGVLHVGLNMAIVPANLDVDYNVYFADGGAGGFPVSWNGVTYDVLATYQSAVAPNEQSTIFKNVEFVSLIDLHLTGNSNGDFDLAGIPIQGITDDIDGDLRHETYPYRGADEAEIPLPVELTSFASSVSGNTVTLLWSTSTETNNYGFDIERKYNEHSWVKAGFVNGSGTISEQMSYSFIDDNLASGSYEYRLKQIDFDGTFKYYSLAETVEIGLPLVYSLEQNYPNPFNPSTKIKYNLPVDGRVTIKVFDILGNEVITLLDEEKAAGSYEFEFNAPNLPSSIYFYRMQSGSFSDVKKMIILK